MQITQTQSPAANSFSPVLFTGQSSSESCNRSTTPLSDEMLELFQQLTGWVVEFSESRDSCAARELSMDHALPAHGSYSITDMSADWPAQTPTSSRSHCDQFVAQIDGLVQELYEAKTQLADAQSQLEAIRPGSVVDDEAILFDCFVSNYDDQIKFDQIDEDRDDDFKIANNLPTDHSTVAVDPPFEGWHFGGGSGFFDGRYVDWKINDSEQICMLLGELENVDREEETRLTLQIDPLTYEYSLQQDSASSESTIAFFLHDQKTGELTRINDSQGYRQLRSSQMVIATTSGEVSTLAANGNQIVLPSEPVQAADRLRELCGSEDHVLILKRCN